MKILICSINYFPEPTGIGKYSGEMAAWLAHRGHEVRVVTAPPHYPEWKVSEGYSSWQYKRELHVSASASTSAPSPPIRVLRCPLWVPRVPRQWKRVLHLISFSVSTFPAMLSQVRWHSDITLLIAPTLFCSLQTICTARLAGSVSWLHLQDFELDAAFELKDFSSVWLRRVSEKIERALMQRFDWGSTISERMVQRLRKKGMADSQCILFPNWVDTTAIYPMASSVPLRKELGIPDNSVVALYAGSMGKKQGMQSLLKLSQALATHPHVHFVFCGGGPAQQLFAQSVANHNVSLLPLQPSSRLNELLNLADIHLLPQLPGAADLVMPSKLTGMLASGRPVLAMAAAGTQLFDLVSKVGVVVPPADNDALASALLRLAACSELRGKLGQLGRQYAVMHMDRERVLTRFETQLLNTVAERRAVYADSALEVPVQVDRDTILADGEACNAKRAGTMA